MSIGIVLMSRAPIPGKTKTRLQTHLTPHQCAELHKAFLQDISGMLIKLTEERKDVNLYLTYTPQGSRRLFDGLIPQKFDFFAQQGTDLGAKMYNSLEYVAQENDYQIILGSDLPTLQPKVILKAINNLANNDIVVGPSQDGGYYLLGTKQPQSFLFDDIIFGNNEVLKATIKAIKDHKLNYGVVDTWSDVDRYPELVELYQKLTTKNQWEFYPRNTAKIVKRLLKGVEKQGGELYVHQQIK